MQNVDWGAKRIVFRKSRFWAKPTNFYHKVLLHTLGTCAKYQVIPSKRVRSNAKSSSKVEERKSTREQLDQNESGSTTWERILTTWESGSTKREGTSTLRESGSATRVSGSTRREWDSTFWEGNSTMNLTLTLIKLGTLNPRSWSQHLKKT